MKTIKFWLTTIVVLLCSITVNADTKFTVDGIEYTVSSTDGTCSVSGYDESFGTEVVIPSSVDYKNRTFSVTSIGYCAFNDCSSLASITIPEGVTGIEEKAFYKCRSLTSFTIPTSVMSIGDDAFYWCSSLKEVFFEDGSKTLTLGDVKGKGLFSDCPLEKVYLGRNLNYNDSYYSPFSDKTQLTSVTIGGNVTSIGKHAFAYCSSLTSITIPANVTSIGDYAFNDCSSLASITIPEGVTGIWNYAFSDCSSLTSITIPASVTSIGHVAFERCTSLKEVTIEDGSEELACGRMLFNGCLLEEVYLGRDLRYETDDPRFVPFGHNSNLTSLTIGESVTSIGDYAFYQCSSLASITIPASVTSIGQYTFYGCSSLASISCLAKTPPTIDKKTFDSDSYNFADLFVPQGTKDAYQAATGWKNFYSISDTLPSGICDIAVGQSSKIYNLNGRELQTPQQGINIINGKKVLVR
ncbi:MAG: leucine-rich repeat domain-containing protein [Bacteroidaceae bacterium]|nr:leucine-rich repeat domain-containing protein [Bacteroidaceae bacterium]